MQTDTGKKFFLITIDTEGDNAWNKPRNITTENAAYLFRFQLLCEKYGLKPTYLTNYEMCLSPVFGELAKEALRKKTAEVGMHLHAWHSPPHFNLTGDDYYHLPYLIEYPPQVLEQKVEYLTRLLEDTFQVKMLSHRAGRWAFNATYAQCLVKLGYKVDCSVTPYTNWSDMMGDPKGSGGTNYSLFPAKAYWMDTNRIDKEGSSPLLQVPVTIVPAATRHVRNTQIKRQWNVPVVNKVLNRLMPPPKKWELLWLRPMVGNIESMLQVLNECAHISTDYVEFMIHSSEFMPGGSPYFKTEADIEILYAQLETLFSAAQQNYKGATMVEYHDYFKAKNQR